MCYEMCAWFVYNVCAASLPTFSSRYQYSPINTTNTIDKMLSVLFGDHCAYLSALFLTEY